MYLDWNATAPMSIAVIKKLHWAQENCWANAHSQHRLGRRTAVEVEKAREILAEIFRVQPKQLRFTSGATEANAWVCSHFQKLGKIATSTVEHPSVWSWQNVSIPVTRNGLVDLRALKQALEKKNISLVSIMAANNETGILQPVEEISKICSFYGIPYHCDASQVLGRLLPLIPADFITISGHKFGAPKGVGALIMNRELPPFLRGGAQERGSRAGTVNAPSIIAMGEAAAEAAVMNSSQQILLEAELERLHAIIIGKEAARLPNTTCALFPTPGDMIVMGLDMAEIFASTGSACSSGSSKDSRVLEAMGYKGVPVRFSWGADTRLQTVLTTITSTVKNMEMTCEW